MSIYNKVSELEWYLCQKALLKEFLSKNAYEKYLSSACKNRTDIVKYKGKEFGVSKAAEFSAEMRH